jgi:Tfp pilus assembly protein PilZ
MPRKIISRKCIRFQIPGTVLHYKKRSLFFSRMEFSENYFPVLDISRGGLCFLSQDSIRLYSAAFFKLVIPGKSPLIIKGTVRWCTRDLGQSYAYRIGVQFFPYGAKRSNNPRTILNELEMLEKRYTDAYP